MGTGRAYISVATSYAVQNASQSPTTCFEVTASESAPAFTARRAWAIFFAYLASQFIIAMVVTVVRLSREGVNLTDQAAIEAATLAAAGPAAVAGVAASAIVVCVMTFATVSGVGIGQRVSWLALGNRRQLAEAFASGVALAVLFLAIAGLIYPPTVEFEPSPLQSLALTPGWPQAIWVLFALAIAPLLEELLFRGVMFSGLQASWGTSCAAIITSVVFVFLHYAEISGYVPALAAIAALAVITLRLRIRTGVIGPAMAAHFGYNFVIVSQALALVG